ncbi:wdr90 [Symbiodinium sp. CCMP2456]|nr:wdr90 [Symbiodinium sp. CCMP2456]
MPSIGRQWQHPFVDIFKSFGTDPSGASLKGSALSADLKGEVSEEMDREICKRVFKVQGSVSANNYIQLPKTKGKVRSLDLVGEFVYLQLKLLGGKYFLIHLDYVVSNGQRFRISLSNAYHEVGTATYHCIQCPCQLPEQWTVVRLHVPSALGVVPGVNRHGFLLRSIQICSSLYVRNVFTSDRYYAAHAGPREILGEFKDWAFVDVPDAGEAAAAASDRMAVMAAPSPLKSSSSLPSASCISPSGKAEKEDWPRPIASIRNMAAVVAGGRRIVETSGVLQVPHRRAAFVQSAGPDGAAAPMEIAGMSCMALVLRSQDPSSRPRFLQGHARRVEMLEASDDGRWVASVQGSGDEEVEGRRSPPVMRLWTVHSEGMVCASVTSLPSLVSVQAVTFDGPAKFLAVAGQDIQNRQSLLVWDMSRADGGALTPVAKQTGPDVACLRFSPFEKLTLISCGMENVRFWRIKDSHLSGCMVPLGGLARQMHFTALAFECRRAGHSFCLPSEAAEQVRFWVGTADGRVIELGHKSRKVLAVHQLHTQAITGLCANESFVVTASADRHVRVWPLDFRSFYLHALHETAVTGIDISLDGRQVLCSTADGSVGMLDLQSHQYQDFLRSHRTSVLRAALADAGQLASVAEGSLKVWSFPALDQIGDFPLPEAQVEAVACHPFRRQIAISFRSGKLLVFDVTAAAAMAQRQHEHRLPLLRFLACGAEDEARGASLVAADTTSTIVLFSEAQGYEALGSSGAEVPCLGFDGSPAPAMSGTPPRLLWLTESRSVALQSLPDARLVANLAANTKVSCLGFSQSGRFVLIGTADLKIRAFEASDGTSVFTAPCCLPLCSLHLADAGPPPWPLMSAAADKLLRIARVKADPEASEGSASFTVQLEQSFISHVRVVIARDIKASDLHASWAYLRNTGGGASPVAFGARPRRFTQLLRDRVLGRWSADLGRTWGNGWIPASGGGVTAFAFASRQSEVALGVGKCGREDDSVFFGAVPRLQVWIGEATGRGAVGPKAKAAGVSHMSIAAQAARNLGGFVPNKIFVGGVPITVTEEQFRQCFAQYGAIAKVELHALRGFGYITYDTVEAVDACLEKYEEHYLSKKWVEVKRSIPRELIDAYEREQRRLHSLHSEAQKAAAPKAARSQWLQGGADVEIVTLLHAACPCCAIVCMGQLGGVAHLHLRRCSSVQDGGRH